MFRRPSRPLLCASLGLALVVSSPSRAYSDDEPASYRITRLDGADRVGVQRGAAHLQLGSGASLFEHDSVWSERGNTLEITTDDGSTLVLSGDSKLEITVPHGARYALQLLRGRLFGFVRKLATPTPPEAANKYKMIIGTKSGVMGVRGTRFVVDSDETDKGTTFHVLEGVVDVGRSVTDLLTHNFVVASAGQLVAVAGTGFTYVTKGVEQTVEFVAIGAGEAGKTLVNGAGVAGKTLVNGAGVAGKTLVNGAGVAGKTLVNGGATLVNGAGAAGTTLVNGAGAAGKTLVQGADAAGGVVGTNAATAKGAVTTVSDTVDSKVHAVSSALPFDVFGFIAGINEKLPEALRVPVLTGKDRAYSDAQSRYHLSSFEFVSQGYYFKRDMPPNGTTIGFGVSWNPTWHIEPGALDLRAHIGNSRLFQGGHGLFGDLEFKLSADAILKGAAYVEAGPILRHFYGVGEGYGLAMSIGLWMGDHRLFHLIDRVFFGSNAMHAPTGGLWEFRAGAAITVF